MGSALDETAVFLQKHRDLLPRDPSALLPRDRLAGQDDLLVVFVVDGPLTRRPAVLFFNFDPSRRLDHADRAVGHGRHRLFTRLRFPVRRLSRAIAGGGPFIRSIPVLARTERYDHMIGINDQLPLGQDDGSVKYGLILLIIHGHRLGGNVRRRIRNGVIPGKTGFGRMADG